MSRTGFAVCDGPLSLRNILRVASLGILIFFQAAKGSNRLVVVVSTVSPGFNSSYKYEMQISDKDGHFS